MVLRKTTVGFQLCTPSDTKETGLKILRLAPASVWCNRVQFDFWQDQNNRKHAAVDMDMLIQCFTRKVGT